MIMKKIIILSALFLSGILFTQCDFSDFGDINVDPNSPSIPDTRFLYIDAVRASVPSFYVNSTYDAWTLYYPQYVSERNNVQFTRFEIQDFGIGGYYTSVLNDLNLIISLNTDESTKTGTNVVALGTSNDNQIAAARTLRAYTYMHLTDAVGMIPYSEALKGIEGNFQPKFDTQEEIYTDLNKELEESFAQFDESAPLNEAYEILYGGDIAKWKKFNASVRMQLAIKLFKADANTGKTRFAKAYGDGFIRSNADILVYKYLTDGNNNNPMYENIDASRGGRKDYWPSSTFVDSLVNYNDPRVTVYFKEAELGGYQGMPFGVSADDAQAIPANTVCYFHDDYWKQNSPAVLITPSVLLLAAAEAAEYGWISDNAKSLYDEAITAAFNQHGLGADVAAYLAQPKVAYKTGGTQAERLEQIAVQKWFASFMQDGMEAWADIRRLGKPVIELGPVSTITVLPRRRIYNSNNNIGNEANLKIALELQGDDNVATRVWWDRQ
jgi:hypothetical protein